MSNSGGGMTYFELMQLKADQDGFGLGVVPIEGSGSHERARTPTSRNEAAHDQPIHGSLYGDLADLILLTELRDGGETVTGLVRTGRNLLGDVGGYHRKLVHAITHFNRVLLIQISIRVQ